MYHGLVTSLTKMLATYTDEELELIGHVFNETAEWQHATALALPDIV